MFDLSGRTVVVTGGGRGIGRGIVRAMARAGADVVLAGRPRQRSRSPPTRHGASVGTPSLS